MEIIAATGNLHKIEEIKALLGDNFTIKGITDIIPDFSPDEDGATFAENAMIKARLAHEATGLPCFADDSGICVDALGGEPGIRSARYALPGQRKMTLLKNLRRVPKEKRTAHFTCAFAFCDGQNDFTVEAYCHGYILTEPDGEGGFGYDPVFYSFDLDKSFGRASAEEKNKISHRARAAKLFAEKLQGIML